MLDYKGNCWPSEVHLLLLKAAFNEFSIALPAFEKWTRLIDINAIDAVSYNLLPKVYKNLNTPTLANREIIKGIYKRTWVQNQLYFRFFANFLQKMPLHFLQNIVLMKGAAMILGYYGDVGVRVLGDIDILVKRELAVPLMHYLFEHGFESLDPMYTSASLSPACLIARHSINFTHKGFSPAFNLDIHWSPLIEIRLSAATEPTWFNHVLPITLSGVELHRLDATNLLFQTCVHGVKHSAVPTLRWILDALILIEKLPSEIDWERLINNAKTVGLMVPIRQSLNFLHQTFQASIPTIVIKKINQSPSSLIERIEYIGVTRFKNEFLNIVFSLWTYSRRHQNSFPRYLMQFWGLEHYWQLPPKICSKMYHFFIRSVGRSK
jgi:hypothetical protein